MPFQLHVCTKFVFISVFGCGLVLADLEYIPQLRRWQLAPGESCDHYIIIDYS